MSRFLIAILSSAVLLSGCQDVPMIREDTAKRTALPVHMIPRTVPADPFTIQAYERVHQKFNTAVLYIEGDGEVYPTFPSLSLPPSDPIGLRLAAQDGSKNVIYLGRPCGAYHNSKYQDKKDCPAVFKNDARFSEAVIHGYNKALDNIKAYHDVTGFEIVGYDGGAAIATILAAQREDIVSLRTIAGNLDTVTTAQLNKVAPPSKSYNPADYANQLRDMPQRHFVGKLDHVTPPAVYASFSQKLGSTPCNSVSLIDNADHEHGWVEQWNVLRTMPVACTQPVEIVEPAPVPFDPTSLDGDKGVDHGQK